MLNITSIQEISLLCSFNMAIQRVIYIKQCKLILLYTRYALFSVLDVLNIGHSDDTNISNQLAS